MVGVHKRPAGAGFQELRVQGGLPCAKKHVLSAQGVVSDQRGTLYGISLELAKTLHLVEKGLPLLEHRMDLGSVCLEAHPVQRVIPVYDHTVDKADASSSFFA